MSKSDDLINVDFAEDLAALRTDVAKLVSSMRQLAQVRAQAAGSNVSDAVDGAAGKISDAATRAKEKAKAISCVIEASIEKNPLTALLLAFGIGLSVAVLGRACG